jgi:ubiquinone/menaquinone biosynthesis C-methylase UbiE
MNAKERWNRTSRTYDWLTFGEDLRQGADKRRLFAKARGRTILIAVGTGADIKFLPPGLDIVGIDISPAMVEKARPHAETYEGKMELRVMDAHRLEYPDESFDTAITACTFCSVPDPVRGLRELHRVLKPEGRLLMYEHVRSNVPAVGLFLDFMTYITRFLLGPDLNRDTLANARRAGFHILSERNVYFDIVKAVEASRTMGAVGVDRLATPIATDHRSETMT